MVLFELVFGFCEDVERIDCESYFEWKVCECEVKDVLGGDYV